MKKVIKKTERVVGFKSNFKYLEAYFDLLYEKAKLFAVRKMGDILKEAGKSSKNDVKDFYANLGIRSMKDQFAKIKEFRGRVKEATELFLKQTNKTKIKLHIENIAKENKLCAFEKDALALAVAISTDYRFNFIAENLGFNSRDDEWKVKDFLNILTSSFEEKIIARRFFTANATLAKSGILVIDYSRCGVGTESDFLGEEIKLPRRISSAIYGEDEPEDMILEFSEIITPKVDINSVILDETLKKEVINLINKRDLFLKKHKEWGIEKVVSYGMGTIMLFSGIPGTGKTMLAHALAKQANMKLLQVNVPNLTQSYVHNFDEAFRMLLREARLQHSILFFDEADELFSDRQCNGYMSVVLKEFEKFDGIAILATNVKQMLDEALDRRILYKLDLELPPPELRSKIWREHLPEKLPLSDDVNLQELSEKYEFSGGYIKNSVLLASQKALARSTNEDDIKVTQADLKWAAGRQRSSQLAKYADKVTPKVKLKDITLPKKLKSTLVRITKEYYNSSKVYNQWGFKDTVVSGKAITALFHGEPGVGKTMAAEALAGELGLNLYPVNIPAIVSCYVGETSKNIKKVFEAAKEAEAVLLFDEADALFAARLDDGSHHAVYINQEISTLLQEIEKFDGIVILTSNLKERMDNAFMRRIRHHLEFKKPEPLARTAIWKHHFPKNAPLDEAIDFEEIGKRYELTGGIIRNIAIKVAFEAACNGNELITQNMLEALIIEETKTQLTKRQIVGFGALTGVN